MEYQDTPPQVFISELNSFIRSRQQLPRGFNVEISWERVVSQEEIDLEVQQGKCVYAAVTLNGDLLFKFLAMAPVRDVPRGYARLVDVPILRGPNHCPKCFCAPCMIQRPPDFLRGSCDPHPANAEKRHLLYKKFWRCLNTLGVWRDEEYLYRKEARTARDDRRDIIPDCILAVSLHALLI